VTARMRVAFRYDDCSAVSSLALEQQLVDLFAEFGGKLSLAVIPRVCTGSFRDPGPQTFEPLPRDKAAFLRTAAQSGRAEVALHGYTHQTWRAPAFSEFAQVPRDEQANRVRSGRAELEDITGVRVESFVPPWNSYDAATMDVLEEYGFSCLSGSLRGPFPERSSLRFLPYSTWLDDLVRTVDAALQLRWLESVLVVMLHDYDFVESGKTPGTLSVPALRRVLQALSARPQVRLCSLEQAIAAGVGLAPSQLGPYHDWRHRCRNLSWRYRRLVENQPFWTAGGGSETPAAVSAYQAYVSLNVMASDFGRALQARVGRLF
jgi:peptidoglycan/xylan/chitin deacetylase (PgdA/CDA1 family)